MRIGAYIEEHYNGNKYRFINGLLAVPPNRSGWDNGYHFSNYLKIRGQGFRLTFRHVYLSDEGRLCYDFALHYELDFIDAPHNILVDFHLTEEQIEMREEDENQLASLEEIGLEYLLGDILHTFERHD
jgi:hypothetical protein